MSIQALEQSLKETKNERATDLHCHPGRMVFPARLAPAAYGRINLNAPGLSGQGQKKGS